MLNFVFSQKRLLSIIALLFVFIISGCVQKKELENNNISPSEITQPVQPKDNKTDNSNDSEDRLEDEKAQNNNIDAQTPKLEITQKGVTLKWTDKGKPKMEASATELIGNEMDRTGTLLNFSATLYENGKATSTFKSDKAVVDFNKKTVTATGGVVVKSLERATTVTAEWIKYDSNTKKIVGNGGIVIESNLGKIEAAAFIADTTLKTYTVKDSGKGLL
ncbi:MAG: LPS export ABC transporter periplasmic protein LptC [Armatimonadota bacterium]